MTPEQFENKMMEIVRRGGDDPERDHIDADDLLKECLRELGYGAGCDAFDKISMWYA